MKTTLFGTDGIRRAVGDSPFTFSELPLLGKAIAQWLEERYPDTPSLLIAHDTRYSFSFVKAALQTGLLLSPILIYDAGIIPTPALYAFVHKKKWFNAGLVVSASHNPYHDNGIKLIDDQYGKITSFDEGHIESLFFEQASYTMPKYYTGLGTMHWWEHASQKYYSLLKEYFPRQFLRGKTVVVDCAHGATSYVAPLIFSYCGANTIVINNQPTGFNINEHCGPVYPLSLHQAVQRYQADVGFSFDGDGDRLVAVTRNNELKDGDDIVALLLEHPLYHATPAVIGTVMSNYGFEHYLQEHGKKLVRVAVGDKQVAQGLIAENLLLGGEPSGHIIMRDYLDTGDGIFTALRLLETVDATGNWDMKSFTKYPQINFSLSAPVKKDLNTEPLAPLIRSYQEQLLSGRLIIRYSGTEELLRVMLEHPDASYAQMLGQSLKTKLQKILNEC